MSITSIKAMTQTLKKMKAMEQSVTEEVEKDITQKRTEAYKAICNYMNEIAKALNGESVMIQLNSMAAGNIFKQYPSDIIHLNIGFNEKYDINSEGCRKSKEPIAWWIAGVEKCHYSNRYGYKWISTKDVSYHDFLDSDVQDINKVKGAIQLIESWAELKEDIEKHVEGALKGKMNEVCTNTENKLTSYKIVDEFEA